MIKRIDRNEVRRLKNAGARIIEVLPREEYEEEHLPGAENIPLKELSAGRVADFDREEPIVVYCNDTL
jgi:rhodanese-related sulfurtransferase